MSDDTVAYVVVWGALLPEDTARVSASLRSLPETAVQFWRGVREPDVFLWWVTTTTQATATNVVREALASSEQSIQLRQVDILRTWGNPLDSRIHVANYVLREVVPETVETLVPKIFGQVDAVVERPGCLGSLLLSEVGYTGHLLGVTYWQDVASFEAYARWAGEHPWRDTINPVTQAVPLRLLTQRVDQPFQ